MISFEDLRGRALGLHLGDIQEGTGSSALAPAKITRERVQNVTGYAVNGQGPLIDHAGASDEGGGRSRSLNVRDGIQTPFGRMEIDGRVIPQM